MQGEELPTDVAALEGRREDGEWEVIAFIGPDRSTGLVLEEEYEELKIRVFCREQPSRDALERAVAGALRSAINDHGPITPEHIGSATKRVIGNLENARRTS